MTSENHKIIARELGLTGAWLEVGRAALCDRKVRIPSATYFLVWGDRPRGIIWIEGEQGIDARVPPMAYWLNAWLFSDIRAKKVVEKLREAGEYPYPPQGVYSSFRAAQEFNHREALLRLVGFHQWVGKFSFLECVPTPIEWEWK